MHVLDIFSGIGGFSLGLERAGMRTVAFCECDEYCRAVLRKHWPDVPCYPDIRELTADRLVADGIAVDVICGGFPCQDISVAGNGAGLAGARSGLWSEYARLVGELRPRFVIVENVSALLARGLGEVLGELAALGYDAEWHCIPASAVGAPHRRDRVWIVAYPSGTELRDKPRRRSGPRRPDAAELRDDGAPESVADSERIGQQAARHDEIYGAPDRDWETDRTGGRREVLPDAVSARLEGRRISVRISEELVRFGSSGWWLIEPDVGRVAHGVPRRVDRLRCLGNAVVPQIPEIIGRAIMSEQL